MSRRSADKCRIRRHVGLRSLALVAAAATTLSGSAVAANIIGTSRDDTIRGTAKADKRYGRQGNDRLYGLAGHDSLNSGAGRDRFSCFQVHVTHDEGGTPYACDSGGADWSTKWQG